MYKSTIVTLYIRLFKKTTTLYVCTYTTRWCGAYSKIAIQLSSNTNWTMFNVKVGRGYKIIVIVDYCLTRNDKVLFFCSQYVRTVKGKTYKVTNVIKTNTKIVNRFQNSKRTSYFYMTNACQNRSLNNTRVIHRPLLNDGFPGTY